MAQSTWQKSLTPEFLLLDHNQRSNSVDPGEKNINQAPTTATSSQVTVTLPHMTEMLSKLLQIMRNEWSDWKQDRPPKQVHIGYAIDEALGYNHQKNGEPSRSAQVLATLIRPDSLRDSDGRVKKSKS